MTKWLRADDSFLNLDNIASFDIKCRGQHQYEVYAHSVNGDDYWELGFFNEHFKAVEYIENCIRYT